jgi:hypothetical protein
MQYPVTGIDRHTAATVFAKIHSGLVVDTDTGATSTIVGELMHSPCQTGCHVFPSSRRELRRQQFAMEMPNLQSEIRNPQLFVRHPFALEDRQTRH